MPKTLTIETDPVELAALIGSDKGIKDAIGKLLAGASITIPPHEIESLEKRIIAAVGGKSKGGPTSEDIATKLLEKMEDRATKATTPSAKAKATTTKAICASRAAALVQSGKCSDEVMAFLWENCAPGLPLRSGKQNTRLCGPAGASKTWRARQFAHSTGFDHVVEVQCLSDMEPRDFIAGPIPGEQHAGFRAPFVDGPLAKAWRLAAKGETVCIILDEVGNVPRSAKQAFQTCLSPFGEYGDEKSILNTGRAIEALDSKGDLLKKTDTGYHEPYVEEIVAPFKNITIIGTQNVGAEYGCAEDTPAIKARLMAKYVATDAKLIKAAGTNHMKAIGWTKATIPHVVSCFTMLWKESLKAKEKSLLEREVSLREIVVCLDKCSHIGDDITKIIPTIKRTLLGAGFNEWFVGNGHDGRPMKEQMDSWADLVNQHII
jgi:hypothetical protein